MGKYGRIWQATHDNKIQRMRFAYWIIKATDTYSEYVAVIAFSRQNLFYGLVSTLHLYVLIFLESTQHAAAHFHLQ